MRKGCFVAALIAAGLLLAGRVGGVAAQETPRHGGELVFVVPAEPPSFDARREESFALIHPAAPHYSTLMRVDPDDPSGTKIVGDLAESWSSAAGGRTWTFKIRRGVKFHDGSELTARDVKALYDKIIFPPAGVASNRRGEYVVVEAVDAPDASTVVFRLKWPAYWADQWRQIGLSVKVETLELATLYNEIRGGNFEVAADFHCSYIVEPDLALFKFQSADVSHVNYSRYTDRTLDELYQRQSRATDREERRRAIREFEKRLLDDEAHYIFTFQWHRIVPHNARLRGWTITPSHFLNNQLDTVWLAPE